jgi:hypothetical protein
MNDLFGQASSLVVKGIPADSEHLHGTGKIDAGGGTSQIERTTIRPLPRSSSMWCAVPGAASGSAAVIWASKVG